MIGLQGLEEGVELGGLGILGIGTGVDLRGFSVRLAPDLLHLPVSIGLDLVQVALALSRNASGFTLALGSEALCDLQSLADHSLVDAVKDIGVVVYSFDPEIEHCDAELRQFLRGGCFDFLFDFLPAELDRWEDANDAGGTAFKRFVPHRLAILVGTHDFDKVVFGD